MNILELTKAIQNKINMSMNSADVIYLSKVLEILNVGVVKSVNTFSELSTSQTKEIYFVEDEKNLYHFSAGRWFLLMNTLSREIYLWGANSSGQLGDNTSINKSSPVSVVGGFTDWISVSAGGGQSLGIRANGTLWAWGFNSSGQLGDNTSINKSSPVSVVGGFTDWISASAGGYHSIGVRANGTLWAWGSNGSGRLGDNTTASKSSPVSVVGGFTDWISASAGRYHNVGVRANGTLWAWGVNSYGTLGDNTVVSRSSPVSVVGGFTDWVSASAGREHSLGVRANGTLWAWGRNSYGTLGDNTVVSKSSPVSVVGSFTDWISASAGDRHSLGVRANGTLWAWGRNSYGTLGDNTVVSRSSPVSVVGGFADWISASAGRYHSLGVRANGTIWAWGNNTSGRLGDNTIVSRSSPVSVVGGFTGWVSASAGGSHSLGIRDS